MTSEPFVLVLVLERLEQRFTVRLQRVWPLLTDGLLRVVPDAILRIRRKSAGELQKRVADQDSSADEGPKEQLPDQRDEQGVDSADKGNSRNQATNESG
ncbi:MAG: hypothetical protein IT300_12585 [Dehalococcoidia bacterium]|nr:hypothetical protein [Dehalococcoidia bacterium]